MKYVSIPTDAPRLNTSWLVLSRQRAVRAHIVKTGESVAKSQKSVNEKNAHLAWRNAYTTSCGSCKWKGRVELDGPRKTT
jgi:hypothetical protein